MRALERCFIGTIHSFCALLLRERPIEARMDPGSSAIDNADDTLVAKRTFHDHLQSLYVESAGILEDLARLGIAPGDLYRTYRRVVRYPEIPIVSEPTPQPDFTRARACVDHFLDAAASALPKRTPAQGWDDLQLAVRRAMRLRSEGNTGDPVCFARILSALEEQYRSEELDRQRYVATARARDLLVISRYAAKVGADDGFWTRLEPFLGDVERLEIPVRACPPPRKERNPRPPVSILCMTSSLGSFTLLRKALSPRLSLRFRPLEARPVLRRTASRIPT